MEKDTTEISVKLTLSGRYVWTITLNDFTERNDTTIERIKQIDNKLRDKFPDHATRGGGRVSNIGDGD